MKVEDKKNVADLKSHKLSWIKPTIEVVIAADVTKSGLVKRSAESVIYHPPS